MVRFIMRTSCCLFIKSCSIYIPIWLDLLFGKVTTDGLPLLYLHSNMVRFIINALRELENQNKEFTFQYG